MSHALLTTFAGNPLDRASDKRVDVAWLAATEARPDARVLVLRRGDPLLQPADHDGRRRIAFIRPDPSRPVNGGESLFLGMSEDGPIFAIDVDDRSSAPFDELGLFEDLRLAALDLPAGDAAICATAKAMAAWHGRHRFCANCGAPSRAVDGGWKRVCGGCQAEHFPRTDPVVIMLAVHQDRCLVARNPNWPERMFSALAGFVEPGETIEEACARELHEEAGLTATGVRYLCSQPWPYPSSLMVGLIAEVASDVVTPDVTEVQEHHWLTRAEVRAVLAGDHADIRPVSKLAIARTLLDAWVEA